MNINEIEKVLSEALKSPGEEKYRDLYFNAIAEYLNNPDDSRRISNEIITIVVRGIDLDRGANFFEYLADAPKKAIKPIWKQIQGNKFIKESNDTCVLKFLTGLVFQSLTGLECIAPYCGEIMALLTEKITSASSPISEEIYKPVIQDYLVEDLGSGEKLPKWESIKATEETIKSFTEIVLKSVEAGGSNTNKDVRMWASSGKRFAEKQIKIKRIEARIPESKVSVLEEMVAHYKEAERILRETVYAQARSEEEIVQLGEQITDLKREKFNLENTIQSLKADIDEIQKKLGEARKEVGERTKINEAFGALKKNDESALLQDIANELKAEYQDFMESESDDMDEVLGEIYREKLRNIFRILSKKGIKME